MEWKEMTRIILEYFSIPLFGSFNRGNEKLIPLFGSLRLCLGVYKGMEQNDHKEIEWNGIYLSKGNELKRMEWNGIKLP